MTYDDDDDLIESLRERLEHLRLSRPHDDSDTARLIWLAENAHAGRNGHGNAVVWDRGSVISLREAVDRKMKTRNDQGTENG